MTRPPTLIVGAFLSASGANPTASELLADHLRADGWTVLPTSSKPARFARLLDIALTIWRRRSEYRVALVDVYSGPAFIWAEVACWLLRLMGKPTALALHGGNLPAFARRWPGRVGRLLRRADRVVTPSRYLQARLAHFGADIAIIPNPVDLAAYPFRLRDAPRPRLVWLRAFHDLYRPSLAIDTLTLLCQTHPDAQLVMVGPDKDGSLARTQRAAKAAGLQDAVTFTGGVPKSAIPGLLADADIFLNTTSADSAPVSVIEALACGLCVVSTGVGGVPFLLDDGDDALLVPPDDPAAMVAALRRILDEQPGLAARLSANARRKAAGMDWSAALPQWAALLNALDALA